MSPLLLFLGIKLFYSKVGTYLSNSVFLGQSWPFYPLRVNYINGPCDWQILHQPSLKFKVPSVVLIFAKNNSHSPFYNLSSILSLSSPTFLYAFLSTFLFTFLSTFLYTFLSTFLCMFLSRFLSKFLYTFLYVFLYKFLYKF